MRLSDFQSKIVVNVNDGKHLGTIIDAEVSESGQIIYFTVMVRHLFKRFLKGGTEVNVTIDQIVKIGTDVILVDL